MRRRVEKRIVRWRLSLSKNAWQIPSLVRAGLGVTATVTFLLMVRIGVVNPAAPRYRFLRARILRRKTESLVETYRRLGFLSPVYISGCGQPIRVWADGIALSVRGTNRYFKTTKASGTNDGASMLSFLRKIGVSDLRTVVDLGANFGEVSLYFSKTFPDARIVAVEPSPKNLEVFRANIDFQPFDCQGIEIYEIAIASDSGSTTLFEAGSESTIVEKKAAQGVLVRTESLASFWSNTLLEDVDFVKIDIEGAAPFLLDDLQKIGSRASVWLIEIGPEGLGPAPFFDLFDKLGFSIADRKTELIFANKDHALDFVSKGPETTSWDFWFFRNEM